MPASTNTLRVKRLGIDTYKEAVLYMRRDCHVCRAEGFEVHARVKVTLNNCSILATLNIIKNHLLTAGEVGLSEYALDLLQAREGDVVSLAHPKPLVSLSFVRAKIYGHQFKPNELDLIIDDVAKGRYSDIHIATFLTACAGGRLNAQEIIALTQSMIAVGKKLSWPTEQVVDKHCVGGLPGNCTTLIVVPIVTAFGLTMPKTSSRAITSPAGTADTMEVLAPVDLSLKKMHKVVEQEQGCIVWGGAVALSPADDILIRVERTMDLDSEGQVVASVLSKKIAAGSSHIVVDIPIGDTAKVRTPEMANTLQSFFITVAKKLGIETTPIFTDGSQPVGRGIGPVLEARDILAVLQNYPDAPQDLRERSLILAGHVLEFSPKVKSGTGKAIAEKILTNGQAWQKFQAICQAQGGLREPTKAKYTHVISAAQRGIIKKIDNRLLARIAKLAGAPHDKAAGVELHAVLDTFVERQQPLYTIHAESRGELNYALSLLQEAHKIMLIEDV